MADASFPNFKFFFLFSKEKKLIDQFIYLLNTHHKTKMPSGEAFIIKLNQNQQKGCELIKYKLRLKKTTPEEIQEISTTYNIPLNFSIKWTRKRYQTLLDYVCNWKYYNLSLWDLLFDKGNYSDEELSKIFYNAFYSGAIKKPKEKREIFEWFISKHATMYWDEPMFNEFPCSRWQDYGISKMPEFHKLLIQHITKGYYDCYQFFYEIMEDQYDISIVDKDGNSYLHNCVLYPSLFGYSVNQARWMGLLDPFSNKYVFTKPISVINKDGETFYHRVLKRKKDSYGNHYEKCFYNLASMIEFFSEENYQKNNGGIDIFTQKDNQGNTVCDLLVQMARKMDKQPQDFILKIKKVLEFFKYDLISDSENLLKLLE